MRLDFFQHLELFMRSEKAPLCGLGALGDSEALGALGARSGQGSDIRVFP